MPIRFGIALMLAMATSLVACKDYGEFVVAQREWVDNDEFPALSAMDLTGINLEFSVGSKAHARVLPEVEWPHPVGSLLDRMKRENDGELPADFDLPLIDGCIYVGLEPRFSRFRRVEFQGRMLLLVTYLVALDDSERQRMDESRRFPVRPRLTIIDESDDMRRFDFDIGSTLFDVLSLEDALGLIDIDGETVRFRKLHRTGADMVLGDTIDIAVSPHRIAEIKVSQNDDMSFHIVWLADNPSTTTEDSIHYAKFDNNGEEIFKPRRLSDSAMNGFVFMHSFDRQLIISWSDSRFASYGFLPKNISKLIVRLSSDGGNSFGPPSSINVPLSNDDNAHMPIYAAGADAEILFLWGLNSSESIDENPLQVSLFDPESMRLELAEEQTLKPGIFDAAKNDFQNAQRRMPIAGFEAPKAADCDQWEERLNLKPTGFGIMTPEGLQPITRLDPEEREDEPDQH